MVRIVNKSVTRGVAGRRAGNVKGVVIHNTWGGSSAEQEANRLAGMSSSQLAAGFAHYYIDDSTIWRTEDTYNMAWHVANQDGNANYLGYEVCANRTTPRNKLLQAEQNAFWQAAQDLKFYGLPVNRNTVRLHHMFSPTECPKRSLIEHCGYDSTYAVPANVSVQLQDYFISQIKKYYDNPKLQPDGSSSANTGGNSGGNKPSGNSAHDAAVAASKPKQDGNYIAKLDVFHEEPKGQARAGGWMVAVKGSPAYRYGFVFFMEHGTGNELARVMSKGIPRPDVSKDYGLPTTNNYGLDATVPFSKLKGKKVDILFRRTNDPAGNTKGGAHDVRLSDIYLTIPK